jgi:hypothetical protein
MMNWKGRGRKWSCSNFRYYPGIDLDGVSKINQNVCQFCRCLGRDPNRRPSRYKSEALLLEAACSFKICLLLNSSILVWLSTVTCLLSNMFSPQLEQRCSFGLGVFTLASRMQNSRRKFVLVSCRVWRFSGSSISSSPPAFWEKITVP